jgi:hypothetical protein
MFLRTMESENAFRQLMSDEVKVVQDTCEVEVQKLESHDINDVRDTRKPRFEAT